MNIILPLLLFTISHLSSCAKTKPKNATSIPDDLKKKIILEHEEILSKTAPANKSAVKPVKITNVVMPKFHPVTATTAKPPPVLIPPDVIQEWANQLGEVIFGIDKLVVRREVLEVGFADIKSEERNGTAIVTAMADALEELLTRRARAAELIMRKAEDLAKSRAEPPPGYGFDRGIGLDEIKKKIEDLEDYQLGMYCRNLRKLQLSKKKHFDARVSLDATSVHVAAEVFDCDPQVVKHLFWSEGLLPTFQKNYAQDSSIEFQYFCSAQGFLRYYPAALWNDMFKLNEQKMNATDVYDCRLRPWYVSAGGAPRDVLILLDASGSMHNSSNKPTAEQFTLALLSALTDDDRVNVLRFNVVIQSPISCFNDKLVPANHVNSAAMMAAMKMYNMTNETRMGDVLTYAVGLLKEQRAAKDRPPSCQQAIVLLTDSLYANYSALMRELDPSGKIRLFTLWLHDPFGLRDDTRYYGDWLSCNRDGYFAELITHNDVTQQVFKILQVMERPLVSQRKNRLTVFSDVYAHVEDPRRSEYYWQNKENKEQGNRYRELRRNKEFLSPERLLKYSLHQEELNERGYYYEGQDLNYRLQISVSVPVFDHTTTENITIKLDEEKQRNSTKTYPVNRLLGVAGVDIPIDHLKLRLPYHKVGAGGSLFLVDHRGNIVIHDNLRPTFDGDVLKPGYRTVDFIDVEQAAEKHLPRHYPKEWLQLRKMLIIDDAGIGNKTIFAKNIFENGMRAILEMREYHWKRVMNHYTAVAAVPLYNRYHKAPDAKFTQQLAQHALKSLSQTDFAIQPDWLYCRHIEPHFDSREAEVLHFIRRRSDEPNFLMQKLKHTFSAIKPSLLDKNYMCNEELMARLCAEVVATDTWAREHEIPGTKRECSPCDLGSVTAFLATENGLTRWQQYHATSSYAAPPDAGWWARGPAEPWYRRAAAAPRTLVVHAPVSPIRNRRVSAEKPPPFGIYSEWYTAAQVLGSPKQGIIGVAGFHFHPHHLKNLLQTITNFPSDEQRKPRCDGATWSCLLVDELGWVLAHEGSNYTGPPGEPLRQHLSALHPTVMAALLNAKVFELNWVHDYQGVCFPPTVEKAKSSSPATLPTILRSLWRSVWLIMRITQEMAALITIINISGTRVAGDTEKEKLKRRRRVWHDFQREKFENLYDDSVIINRTRVAACDRTRPIYVLQNTPKAKAALKRPPSLCSWPLVAAPVPDTNLLLIAVYNDCPAKGVSLPDPLTNEVYLEPEPEVEGVVQSSASRLACWRNRQPLPARAPHVACYPHEYAKEKGYRQCGPWLPDPEPEEDAASHVRTSYTLILVAMSIIIVQYVLDV